MADEPSTTTTTTEPSTTTTAPAAGSGPVSTPSAPAAPAAPIDWAARAVAAEAEVEVWKKHSRTHEDASKEYRGKLTDWHRNTAITDAAKTAGFLDPSDALEMVSVRDAARLNKDFALADAAKLTEALGKVLEAKPHLKKAEEPKGGAAGPGTAGTQAPTGHIPTFTQGTASGEAMPSVDDIVAAAMKRTF